MPGMERYSGSDMRSAVVCTALQVPVPEDRHTSSVVAPDGSLPSLPTLQRAGAGAAAGASLQPAGSAVVAAMAMQLSVSQVRGGAGWSAWGASL